MVVLLVSTRCGHLILNLYIANVAEMPDEPPLKYSIILAMDGNESQRRNGSNNSDPRRFDSTLYLSPEEVDAFANEVKHRKVSSGRTQSFMLLTHYRETVT